MVSLISARSPLGMEQLGAHKGTEPGQPRILSSATFCKAHTENSLGTVLPQNWAQEPLGSPHVTYGCAAASPETGTLYPAGKFLNTEDKQLRITSRKNRKRWKKISGERKGGREECGRREGEGENQKQGRFMHLSFLKMQPKGIGRSHSQHCCTMEEATRATRNMHFPEANVWSEDSGVGERETRLYFLNNFFGTKV